MTEDERERLKRKLVEKKIIPNMLSDFNDLKVSLDKKNWALEDEEDDEIKKALSSLKRSAQKKY